MDWFIKCVTEKYADFDGRATRSEYWFFTLFFYIGYIAITVVASILAGITNLELFALLPTIYALALLLPSIAVGIRRLHDTSRSGWWLLLGLIPIIGAIVLLVFTVQDSTFGRNEYGPNPKNPSAV